VDAAEDSHVTAAAAAATAAAEGGNRGGGLAGVVASQARTYRLSDV